MSTSFVPLFSFRGPTAPRWALFVLAAALLLAGAVIALLALLAPGSIAPDDLVGIGVLGGLLVVGGLALLGVGLRETVAPSEWHLTPSHAIQTRGPRVVRSIELAGLAEPTLTSVSGYGGVLAVRVQLGRDVLVTPTEQVASAVYAAWAEAQQAP